MRFFVIVWFFMGWTTCHGMNWFPEFGFFKKNGTIENKPEQKERAASEAISIPKKPGTLGQARSLSVGSEKEIDEEDRHMQLAASASEWTPGCPKVYSDLVDLLASWDKSHGEEKLYTWAVAHLKIFTPDELTKIHPKQKLNAIGLIASYPQGYFDKRTDFWQELVDKLLHHGVLNEQPSHKDGTFSLSALEHAADNNHTWLVSTLIAFTEEECVICNGYFNDAYKAKSLSCGHYFHAHCLNTWLTKKPTCPLCCAEVTTEPEKK